MAEASEGFLARAMVVATSCPDGGATARTVVMGTWGPAVGGLVFGSNPNSLKGRQLVADPRCEAVLRWGQRQVRVRGTVRLGNSEESDAMFRRLSSGQQMGLTFLQQGRRTSETEHDAALEKFLTMSAASNRGDGNLQQVTRPESYSAFVLEPETLEFYQGGHPGYVNDRLLYVREEATEARMDGNVFVDHSTSLEADANKARSNISFRIQRLEA